MYGSVVREGSTYRIWLGEWEPYYAESTDGLRWSKLRLLRSLSPHGWSPRNLCITRDGERAHADHAFKLGYHCGNYKSTESTCVASSADGIAWTPWGGGKHANAEARCDQLRQCCGPGCASAADTYNCMYRRAADGAHLLINRRNYGTKRAWREIRGVRLSANRHLWHNFTGFGVVSEWYLDRLGKDERYQRQVYSLSVAPLHAEPPAGISGVRAEGAQIYMGLLTLIEWAKIGSLAKKRAAPPFTRDVLSVYLITSRDGVHFDLSSVYAQNPLIPRGACAVDKPRRQPWPAAGSAAARAAWAERACEFDHGYMQPASSMVSAPDGRHMLYYEGRPVQHEDRWQTKATIGVATWARHRIAALARRPTLPAGECASLTTRAFALPAEMSGNGTALTLNADASAAGAAISVGVLLADEKKELAGFEGYRGQVRAADGPDLPVRWMRSLGALRGERVRLRMALCGGARLYSYTVWSDSVTAARRPGAKSFLRPPKKQKSLKPRARPAGASKAKPKRR